MTTTFEKVTEKHIGCKVWSSVYGEGTIESVSNDGVDVSFEIGRSTTYELCGTEWECDKYQTLFWSKPHWFNLDDLPTMPDEKPELKVDDVVEVQVAGEGWRKMHFCRYFPGGVTCFGYGRSSKTALHGDDVVFVRDAWWRIPENTGEK